MAIITFLDGGPVDPSFGVPGFSGGRPDNSLPGGGVNYPSQGLPGGGHISLLPVYPFDPTLNPDNSLPNQPEAGNDLPRPGKKYVVKWLACQGLILVPDNSLPGSSARPDNELPETGQPK
jgi:hypothetical protein